MSTWMVSVVVSVVAMGSYEIGRWVTAHRQARWSFRMTSAGGEIRGEGLTWTEMEKAHAYWRAENHGRE